VQKALWYVESHSASPIGLNEIADAVDVSPYHLTRAFATFMGTSLIRYLRRRRLSESAKRLVAGETDILRLALDFGYGSHEAFTRAFKDEFGLPPEQLRARGTLENLNLTEPFMMTAVNTQALSKPRIETLPPKLMAGIVQRYECSAPAAIPSQWQRFSQYLGSIPGQLGQDAYGICYNFDDEGKFDYMSAVEIKEGGQLPFGLVQLSLPEQKYAVFSHAGHISEIRSVMSSIWNHGIADAGLQADTSPTLEVYRPQFNPTTGNGGFEVWIAIR